jgi:predicted RNA-binding protein with PIN domain
MAREFLIVDAHNAIFAHRELAEIHRRAPTAAREQLVRLLEAYQDSSNFRIVAVFDGNASSRTNSTQSSPAGIQIFYPQAGQSADAIIERLVVKYSSVHRITVASNDHLVRTAAIAAGASSMDTETLFEEISVARRDLDRSLEKLRRR